MSALLKMGASAAAIFLALHGVGAQSGARGYLAEGFDLLPVLAPPPVAASPEAARDATVYAQTRKVLATERGAMARADRETSSAHMFDTFACELSLSLSPESAPRTVAVLRRASYDVMRSATAAKTALQRPRPTVTPGDALCSSDGAQDDGFDYPSGHAALGRAWAIVLGQVDGAHADALARQGHAYGESRVVCGAHTLSAVRAGRQAAELTMAEVSRTPRFRQDVEAARLEIARLRQAGSVAVPAPAQCKAEAATMRPLFKD